MQIDLNNLDPNALAALIELKRHRAGEKMADVWPLVDDYMPDEQRSDTRRLFCNAVLDMVLAADKQPQTSP